MNEPNSFFKISVIC